MNSNANVQRLFEPPFPNAGFNVCLFAGVGDHCLCLRLHCFRLPCSTFARDVPTQLRRVEQALIIHIPLIQR
jgi:hypothetical protein